MVEIERAESALEIFEDAASEIERVYGALSDHPWSWVGQAVDPLSRGSLVDSIYKYANLLGELDDITQRLCDLGIDTNLDSPALLADLVHHIESIPVIDGEISPRLLSFLVDHYSSDAIQ